MSVAYGSDIEAIETALIEIATEESLVLETPSPQVRFLEFADSAITVQLRCYIRNPALRDDAIDRLVRRIKDRFERDSIKIPFLQRELTFANEAEIDVNLVHQEP